jgi:hypothetical protein
MIDVSRLAVAKPATQWLVALSLALFFGLWALRGVGEGGVVSTDAARHAMNGAMIHDWLWGGPLASPLDYARWYYTRTQSLSLSYHPPLFPLLEAAAFSILGVSAFTARLVVAIATALSVLLMYRLVLATHGSYLIALAATAVAFSLTQTQVLSQDVMLELPALVFVLAALLVLARADASYTWRRALAYGAWSVAAVWTKQLAVFLIAVPFLVALLARRGGWLSAPPFWLSIGLVGLAFAAVELVPVYIFGVAPERVASWKSLPSILLSNSHYYLDSIDRGVAALTAVSLFGLGLPAAHGTRTRFGLAPGDALYWACIIALLAVLLVGNWHQSRYLFFLYPAIAALACAVCYRAACRLLLPSPILLFALIAVAAVAGTYLQRTPLVQQGPAEASLRIAADHPARVLYAGEADGQFVFALRSTSNELPIVIRGDKLPSSTFDTNRFETFATDYGVTHVVLEDLDKPTGWEHLVTQPSPSMIPIGQIAMSGLRNGSLHLYRFTNRSPHPETQLEIRTAIGTALTLDWSTPSWNR